MNLNRLSIVLLLVAIALRSDLFFVLLYIVVGLQVVTRAWLAYQVRSLTWSRVVPETAFPGERLRVEVTLRNRGLLPIPWVALHESLPPALHSPPMIREVVSLSAGERRVIAYELFGQRRGYYQIGPLSLQTGDVLGLGERPMASEQRSPLTIYPHVLPLADLGLPASLPYGTLAASRRLFEDPARPAGVRPYQPSDGVRRIDWKASAHAGQALVRRQQPSIALETLVALAFTREEYGGRFAYDTMEHALIAAASILSHLANLRQPFGVCVNGFDPATQARSTNLPLGHGRAHLISALGLLGRLEPVQEGQLLPELRRATAGLGWGSTVVIITGQRGEAFLAEALGMRRRGLNVTLILTEATPEELALPRRHGIAAYTINRDGRPIE
jgi:uncharacterized protein (DUF58 family)